MNQPAPLLVYNLLNDLASLRTLLLGEVRRGSWLNAYLLAAGMNQITEDYLHPNPYLLGKASRYLARMHSPVGRLGASGTNALATTVSGFRSRIGPMPRISSWQVDFAAFVLELADIVACPAKAAAITRERLLASTEALMAPLDHFPSALRREVLRLPSCFRSFDQQPADLARIVREFARRWPDRRRPLVVTGVRTSGSYLAPLYAACLKCCGYQNVQVLTIRPGRRPWNHERLLLKALVGRCGLVLLTDDPPVSGNSLAAAVEDLKRVGVPSRSIVMLLQLLDSWKVPPPRLRHISAVVLPWEAWAIHEQLVPAVVHSTLVDLTASAYTVSMIERLPLPPKRGRGHIHALFSVKLVDGAGQYHSEQHIYVRGVGLGYFGDHALAITQALGPFVPKVFGVQAGLLFRAWLPEQQRISLNDPAKEFDLTAAIISYVEARHRTLRVEEDVSPRLIDRLPAWEAAGILLSYAFGPGWMIMRRPIVDRIVKRLLQCAEPSIIDGSMMPSHWFNEEGAGHRLLKVDFDERAFSNRDLACYDPIFDVAGMAASLDLADRDASGREQRLPRFLRIAYESLSSVSISPERWLLYQLVHLWNLQRLHDGEWPEVRRAMSRSLQRYFTEIFFKDVPVPSTGSLCAIDLDGVLESSPFGFIGLTPAGAASLRALTLHGYRPVLATGRSLGEVRERCAAYHLTGGVGEYGAVIYNHGTGEVRCLLSDHARHDLDRLRASLRKIDGVLLDHDYCYAVRAYRLDSAGTRRSLSPEEVAAALRAAGVSTGIRSIPGQAQTDFMVDGIDKGTGLQALVAELDADGRGYGGKLLALAVGDSVSDLPMFDLAAVAFAPANADAWVRNSTIKVLRRPYQSGLTLAAARFLGHPPGGCPTCRGIHQPRDRRFFLAILAAQEAGTWGMAQRALLLMVRVWGSRFFPRRTEAIPCTPR